MLANIESNEILFRLFSFISLFLLFAFAEWKKPKRQQKIPKIKRWINNLGIMILNSLLLRALFPFASAGFAFWCASEKMGLFHQLSLPSWLEIILSIIALDGIIWLQHLLFHKVPILGRFHAVHHTDLELDITSGTRFHPVEMLISMMIKFASIALLGAPVIAVILFEVILNGMALFNHSNFALPLFIDKPLRRFFVTPDMHRIHHSVSIEEQNSNFGFNLSVWDRVFNTYKEAPEKGHESMILGVHSIRDEKDVIWISGLLKRPFKKRSKVKSARKIRTP